MSTQFSNRITIDDGWNGTTFVIPAKKDWRILFIGAWLAFWAIMPFHMIVHAYRSLSGPRTPQWFVILWSLGWVAGIVFASSSILWSLGGKDVLRLSASELDLTRSVFGFVIRKKLCNTSDVRNLRFTPAYSQGRSRRESHICYEDPTGTVRFGSGLDDSEALALIDRMLAIYPFSKKDRALEYIDLNGK